MNLARFALRNDKVIFFIVAVLAILGVRAYLQTPQSIFPNMSFSKIDLVADAGDLPPDRVRIAVLKPLELAIEALPNVQRLDGTASQGSAELLISFSSSTDPQVDQQLVSQAVSQTRASIPDATNIVAEVVNPNNEPILSYALTSRTLSTAVLGQMAVRTIQPALFGATGLGRVTVGGAPAVEYDVALDPSALAIYGIAAGDVVRALQNVNAVQAVGAGVRGDQRYAIIVDASLHDVATIGAVAATGKNGVSVPISSLGKVTLGVAPATTIASYDATHAVVINAYPLAGADTVKMAADVEARLAAVRAHLPRDVTVSPFWNQTTLVVASQTALRDAILLGALIAIAVIFVFLRSLRLTAIAAAVIPVAMAIAIFALELAGQTLNLMSVGGLAVAVGLIIDDAIVVIENIERTLREHPQNSARENIALAMSQLVRPMMASTAATVVVFLPLALLTGVTGYFFRALAFTLSASLIVSLGLALFVAPNIARALFRGHAEGERKANFIDRILERYEPLLRWSLGHRIVLFIGAGVTMAVTVVLLSLLPSDFLPKLDEGQFEIAYAMPTGLSLRATDVASTKMEHIVLGEPGVQSVGRITAADSNGYSPTTQNKGLLRVALLAPDQRGSYPAISADLRAKLVAAIPSATFDFHQILEDLINGLSGTPAPIEISVRAADQATLIQSATAITDRISKVTGVVDAVSGVVYDAPSLRISPYGARLAALGLSPSDLGDAVSASTLGTVATQIGGQTQQYPVRVRLGSDPTLASLDTASLYTKGSATSLSALAGIRTVRQASDENEQNGTRIMRVTANVQNVNLSAVIGGIKASLASLKFPAGVTYEIGGQYAVAQASFAEFVTVISVAVALVFSVMLATFRSFRLPLVILTAVPLALIGVALALFLTGTPFNVSSFMGLLLLVGIVVKNGILLIDVANTRRLAGDDLTTALVAAGKTRLRPIVMTTLAAIGGLVPLALGLGQGSEMEKPLAIAVIGGLSTATVFTLVVIPVLYAAFAGNEHLDAAEAA